jgi:hypothetical protein
MKPSEWKIKSIRVMMQNKIAPTCLAIMLQLPGLPTSFVMSMPGATPALGISRRGDNFLACRSVSIRYWTHPALQPRGNTLRPRGETIQSRGNAFRLRGETI